MGSKQPIIDDENWRLDTFLSTSYWKQTFWHPDSPSIQRKHGVKPLTVIAVAVDDRLMVGTLPSKCFRSLPQRSIELSSPAQPLIEP